MSDVTSPPAKPGAAPRRTRRRVATTVVVAAAVAAIGIALVRGWGAVSRYDWQLRPGWLALGTVLIFLAYLINGLAYVYGVELLTSARPPRRVSLSIWARSLLARYIPGNVMMVVGRAVLHHDEGVSKRVTVAATVYEQALGLGLATVGAVGYLAGYGNPGDGRFLWLLLIVPLLLVAIHPVPFRKLSTWALTRLRREPFDTLFTGRQVLRLTAIYALGMAPLVVGVWALVHAAAGASAGAPLEVGLAFLLAFVISLLVFIVPSGLGVRDGIFALALARNLPGGVAVAVAVGIRFALTIIELVFVGAVAAFGRRR